MQDVASSSLAQNATTFLTVMSALSTAVQQLVEHVIKKRSTWLDTALTKSLEAASDAEKLHEARRTSVVHLVTFLVGGALSWSVGLRPLVYLGLGSSWAAQQSWVNAVLAGIMIAFGSSFFDEALGALREWRKAQEAVRAKLG